MRHRTTPVLWTEDEIAFLRGNWLAMSASKVGRAVGKTRSAVIGRARRLGLVKGSPRKPRETTWAYKAPWKPGDPIPAHLALELFA